MKRYETSKLVKMEDLNHHDTLFAGRLAEWFTEATFIGASHLYGKYGELDHLVSIETHSFKFLGPSVNGDIIRFVSKGIKAGTTSLTLYTEAFRNDTDIKIAEGFVSFVCINSKKKKIPHFINLEEPQTQEDKDLLARLERLLSK